MNLTILVEIKFFPLLILQSFFDELTLDEKIILMVGFVIMYILPVIWIIIDSIKRRENPLSLCFCCFCFFPPFSLCLYLLFRGPTEEEEREREKELKEHQREMEIEKITPYFEAKDEEKHLNMLLKIIKVSKKLKISSVGLLMQIFDIERKIYDWGYRFEFKVEDEYIIFENANIEKIKADITKIENIKSKETEHLIENYKEIFKTNTNKISKKLEFLKPKMQKLKEMMKVSSRLKISTAERILITEYDRYEYIEKNDEEFYEDGEEEVFFQIIFEWAYQLGYRMDDEYIEVRHNSEETYIQKKNEEEDEGSNHLDKTYLK